MPTVEIWIILRNMKYTKNLLKCLLLWAFFSVALVHTKERNNPQRLKFTVSKMSFLLSATIVGSTDKTPWCEATVKTPMLVPGKKYNETEEIKIGNCDQGSIQFNVRYPRYPPDPKVMSVVDVSFNTSNIDTPPTCSIPWNGTYVDPKSYNVHSSSLPGCYVKIVQPAWDSYMEYSFYFKIFDWDPHFDKVKK